MPKCYWIGRVDVSDPETYKLYAQAAVAAFQKYNGRVLARGGRTDVLEGQARQRNIVVEFDSMEQARACFDSPEYQAGRAWRHQSSTGELILVEGV